MEGIAIEIERRIQRRGRTTNVYKARDVLRHINLAIKEVEIKDPRDNYRVAEILEHLKRSPNIIHLLGSVLVEHTSRIFLAFKYVESTSWENIQNLLSSEDLHSYMHQLFQALTACHNHKIIHRNIKPENLLIQHGKRYLRLIGWSQAVYHESLETHPLNVSTYECMSPELLLNGPNNGYSVDLWSAGCILACSIFRKKDLFDCSTEKEQLLAIAQILGSKSLMDYVRAYNIKTDSSHSRALSGFRGESWTSFINTENRDTATDEAIDLLSGLLIIDPFKRLSLEQAMSHSYLRRPHEILQTPSNQLDQGREIQCSSNEAGIPRVDFNYELSELIGEGTYGKVYKLTDSKDGQEFVAKVMKHGGDMNLPNEISLMEKLQGAPNIIKYYGSIRGYFNGLGVLILEYVQFTEWERLHKSLTSPDIQYYVYHLLLALDACHSLGIMHRDVKPSNMLIDPTRRILRLIDFGQAIQYQKGMKYSTDIGTREYKSPELLLGYQLYDFSVDLWSVGCILASAIFRIRRLFDSTDKKEILIQAASLVGPKAMLTCFRKYNNDTFISDSDLKNVQEKEWSSLIRGSNRRVATKRGIDLVSKLLVCQPERRLTAKQALEHNYFKRISKLIKADNH